MTSPLRCVDLFAGTGAFSHVFEKHGIQCVFANDMEKSSESIYNINNPENREIFVLKNLNDIHTDDIPQHDILCGGFPCQPFSNAGEQKGFDDTRANVFWKILAILKAHQPRIIL